MAPLSVPIASIGPVGVEVISTAVALSVILSVQIAVHSWFGFCLQSFTDLSLEAVAKVVPSGDQQQSRTILECALSSRASGSKPSRQYCTQVEKGTYLQQDSTL
jgi:hypothetical protein